MERWDRAEKLNLSPPADVRRILEERKDDAAFAECVWERLEVCLEAQSAETTFRGCRGAMRAEK